MRIKYCLPIIRNSKKEVLKSLDIKGFDFYEVWLDYILDLDEKFLLDLAADFKGKIIFVFRRQNLRPIKLSPVRRKEIISLLSKLKVFFDIDFLTQHEELEFLKMSNTEFKLILSYHNYKETPNLDYLKNLVNKMERYNPYIIKLATFCKSEKDSLRLLTLILELKDKGIKYIVIGMGEKGLITRIFGSIWGNAVTFAPKILSGKSAPGQLTKTQMETILGKIL